MNFRYLKILLVVLGLAFISQGCLPPPPPYPYRHHYHYRGYWHHPSIQQSEQSAVQMAAQYNGGSWSHEQKNR
jgi:hypothetical protein